MLLDGRKKGAYILHHNLKDAGGGGGWGDWPDYDPFSAAPRPEDSMTADHGNYGAEVTTLVGVPPVHVLDM